MYENALELQGLCRSLGDFTLGPLDLVLPRGCVMGLVGENGAGKSTTMKLILGMLRPDAGRISILGREDAGQLRELKEELGVVLDEVGLPECLTIGAVGKVMAGTFRRWDECAYQGYLRRFALPGNKPFREFSRGMKMKLGIAVALSHHPKLLLLDEATSGLDPVVRDEVVDLLGEFTRDEDHAVLLSSHIVSDLEKLCDYIAFLHQGRLLFCDEKDRLLEEYGIFVGTADQVDSLQDGAVVALENGGFGGVRCLVKRDLVPESWALERPTVEDIVLFLVKGAKRQ